MGTQDEKDNLAEAGIPALLLQQLKGETFNEDGSPRKSGKRKNNKPNAPLETTETFLTEVKEKSPRKTSNGSGTLKKSNNAWNYRSQRNKLNHLIDHPPSINEQIGTRDISFLHDNSEKPSLAIENSGDGNCGNGGVGERVDTLLPAQFQLVRSERVAGLNVRPSKYATQLGDEQLTTVADEAGLRVFPSLYPNRRFEVKQLDRTFERMIDELGISEPEVGPSQMHNLIELVKKEQNIYDTVFYEIIRQVTVECKERGQLLSKLRRHYADLIARIPRQVNSLHCEVIAQRALDRKLTGELMQFKQNINTLTQELSTVKKKDEQISEEAENSKDDLQAALEESAKNSAILHEYHQLYELQRQRLERQIKGLTFERDIWNATAYSLGLKLIEENELTISRRLYVSERAWSKMGNHFAVIISERDSINLIELQKLVGQWREGLQAFEKSLDQSDGESRNTLQQIQAKYNTWHKTLTTDFVYTDFTGSRRMHTPTAVACDQLVEDFEELKKDLATFLLRFSDGDSLAYLDKLSKMNELIQIWTDVAIDLYGRHRSMQGDKFAQHEVMSSIYDLVLKLHTQLQLQVTGENGVSARVVQMQNELGAWSMRIEKAAPEDIDESDWQKCLDKFVDWADCCDFISEYLGSISGLGGGEKDIKVDATVKEVAEWLHNTMTGIDAENGKLSGMLTACQGDMLKWMSSSLLLLVPDKSNNHLLRQIAIPSQVAASELIAQQESLAQRCIDLSDYIAKCSQSIVTNQFKEETSEFTLLDKLKNFQHESVEWERASQFLCESLASYSDLDIVPPMPKAPIEPVADNDEEAKKEADFALDEVPLEKEDHIRGEEIFTLGSNEIITSRPISRPSQGSLAAPLTENSSDEFKTLSTVSQLQMELLNTEERAQTAELKIEDLEEKVRELERKLTRGEPLDDKPTVTEDVKPASPVQKEDTKLVATPSTATVDSMRSETSAQSARSRPSTTSSSKSNKVKKPKKKGR